MTNDAHNKSRASGAPGVHRLVLDDLRRPGLLGTLRGEMKDLYDFFLDDERRRRLESMHWIKRSFLLLAWLLQALILRLPALRRVLLLVALLLTVIGPTRIDLTTSVSLQTNFRVWSIAILVFILMLELKDKLLIRDEIDVARQVQQDLLPREHPEMDGWTIWSSTLPANDVGGDLIDYVPLPEGQLGATLGDVSGKGMGAALLMAKLQATLRAVAGEYASLSDLGHRLNSILFRDGLDNRFATLFYARLESRSGQVRILNAGHNPPVVTGPHQPEGLAASGLPLGMLGDSTYHEATVDLAPGQMLIAYSDGLTEACDPGGQEYGLQRLKALLPQLHQLTPAAAGACILADANRFTGGGKPADDLSLLILRRHQ